MNFSKITSGEEYKLSFGLNIAGTSATPTEVRVSVGQDLKISKIARRNSQNEYEVSLPIIPEVIIGTQVFVAIEILLNGKLIVPYKELVDIENPNVTVVQPSLATPALTVSEPTDPVVNPVSISDLLAAATNYKEEVEVITDVEDVKEHTKPTVQQTTVVKEEKKKIHIDFSSIKKRDKIATTVKPVSIKLDELQVEKTPIAKPVVKQSKPEVKVTEMKISKVPFKLTKTKIVER